MAKNRKAQSIVVRFGLALKICLCCLFLAGFAIGYLGQKNQLQLLAGKYRDLERRLIKAKRDNVQFARILDAMQTPSELEARIKQMNLGMTAPMPDQIVRLAERMAPAQIESTNRLYADYRLQIMGRE